MSRKLALIIGNSEYQDPALAKLVTPGKDASRLTEVLRAPEIGGFDDVLPLINETETALRRAIERLFAGKKKDDTLLLYFSGHGVLNEQGQLYLAVRDTEHDLLNATAIPASFIRQIMDESNSRRQVLILDCCNSGAFGRGAKALLGKTVSTAAAFEGAGYGRVVLTATDAVQYAWEGEAIIGEASLSVFTHFLVEGLQTGAADSDGDGWIGLDELYDYVHEQVVRATPRQRPAKFAEKQQGQLVIAHNPRRFKQKISGDIFIIESPIHLELIRIPAGEFLMGSDSAKDRDAHPDEQPQHRVYVSEFYISKYPVTNAQYAVFVKGSERQQRRHWEKAQPPSGQENYPLTGVSWDDAVAFCYWLSQKSGKLFRLPTEAEWEKAARGTDGRIYPWGNEWDAGRKPDRTERSVWGFHTPVGTYSPACDSPYGVADMSSVVREWCANWYYEDEYKRRVGSVVKDPQGPSSGEIRAIRGSLSDDQWMARAASRLPSPPSSVENRGGIRVVASPS